MSTSLRTALQAAVPPHTSGLHLQLYRPEMGKRGDSEELSPT